MKKLFLFVTTVLLGVSNLWAQEEDLIEDLRSNHFYANIGYLNKEWVTNFHGKTLHENFWGEEDKRLHGLRFEFGQVRPISHFGLGIKYGLAFEFCYSESDYVHDLGWDSFSEFSLYAPLHISWDIPCGRSFCLQPFVGVGANWALFGTFQEDHDPYWYDEDGNYCGPHEFQEYGNDHDPRRWNNQFEFGLNLCGKVMQVGFTYSRGLTDHRLYKGFETNQNKLAINVGVYLWD